MILHLEKAVYSSSEQSKVRPCLQFHRLFDTFAMFSDIDDSTESLENLLLNSDQFFGRDIWIVLKCCIF